MMRRRRAGHLFRRVAALGAAGLLAASLALPALAAPPPSASPVTLTADHIEYNTQTGVVVADGHVRASRDSDVITADHLSGNLLTGDVEATGHVTLVQAGRTATGESLHYNYRTRVGQMQQVVTTYGPWHMTGGSLETSARQGVAYNTSLTPCDPRHPAFHVTASKVVVVPGNYLKAYNASLYVYSVRVFTLPVYTVSLKPGGPPKSGPTVGYDSPDGAFVEYDQFFAWGDNLTDQFRIRYATLTRLTAENTLKDRAADHLWTLHLGREQVYDQNGNLLNVDRNSLDLVYDAHGIPGIPVSYQMEGHYGQYNDLAVGADTTRADGLLAVSSSTFPLAPSVSGAASAYYRFDSYGNGQQRTIAGVSAAVTDLLTRLTSTTLSYNLTSVTGATPFQFDALSAADNVTLSYSYYPSRGLFQSGTASAQYDFFTRQTTLGTAVALAISPTVQFAATASYNLTTQQFTEVDYAVNATCDCVSIGLLYRTFPTSPSQNVLYLTISLNPFPGTSTQLRL